MKIMEYLNYERRVNKSITEVKMYLLLLIDGECQQEIHDLLNKSIDNKQLQKKIRKRTDIALLLFTKIKKALDQADTLEILEDHLVYLNILLDPLFPPVVSYKYNLFQYLINNEDFTGQTYCLLRHLIKFEYHGISDFILYMCQKTNKTNTEYHYLATEIFCIEQLYGDAYHHLQYVTFDEYLQTYKFGLYQYSPYRFKKIMKPKRRRLQQVILNR